MVENPRYYIFDIRWVTQGQRGRDRSLCVGTDDDLNEAIRECKRQGDFCVVECIDGVLQHKAVWHPYQDERQFQETIELDKKLGRYT